MQDIIIEVNDEKIENNRELINAIGLMSPGEEVDIRYVRDGKTEHVVAVLGQRTTRIAGGDIHSGLSGAEFQATALTRAAGIEVASVEDNSPAAQRGLREGDIVVEINRTRVNSISEMIGVASETTVLFLLVDRGGRSLMLQVR